MGTSKKDPSGDRLIRLADLFGVSTGVVLGYDPMPGASRLPDDEMWKEREKLRNDPDRRALMNLARRGSAQAVRQAAALLDVLKATNPDFYNGDDPA